VDLLDSEQANADLSGAAGVERARMMILRSECHLALDQRDAAWQWLEQAQSALTNEQSVSADQLRAFIGVDRGQLLSLNGKLNEANGEYERALALAVQSGSAEQEYRASRLLGNNVAIAGDDQRAVQLLTRALELARRTLGPTHRSTLTTTGNLATTQARLKQWTEAEATITGALAATQDIRHRGATPDIIIAQLRDDYASVLWQQGRLDECMEQSGQALAIYERMVSPKSSQGFNPSWRVAVCAYQAGQMDIAFAHAEKALRFAQNGVPVGVINALRMLGAVSARRDQLSAAADYLKRADAALATTEVAGKSVYPALQLAHALLAIRSGDRAGAQAYLQQADDSIAKAELKAAWLDQERADVAAMIAAAD
jgi:tetratricopeptide (TPR) repeat protein